ncbi:cyclin-dependent kinase inhibitor 1 [Pelodytes ibericus]
MQSAKAILLPASGSSKVCRNIFGPVDHEELKKDYKKMMKSALVEATQRWNFDFTNETPLEGDYKWEKVDNLKSDNPAGTNNQPTCTTERETEDTCQENNIVPSQELCQGLESSASRYGKRKQKLITDFYNVKRRCSPSPPPTCPSP